jgi:hypothetical protein
MGFEELKIRIRCSRSYGGMWSLELPLWDERIEEDMVLVHVVREGG